MISNQQLITSNKQYETNRNFVGTQALGKGYVLQSFLLYYLEILVLGFISIGRKGISLGGILAEWIFSLEDNLSIPIETSLHY